MPDIRFLRTMIDGIPVVTAPPEIDITNADELRAVLLDTATRGHAKVVVDLTLTRFCDSCGLHTLLRAHKLAQAAGGELRLVTPADGAVPRIFALTCLDRLIPCFTSLQEALVQTPAANPRRDARGPGADQSPMELRSAQAVRRSTNCLRSREPPSRRAAAQGADGAPDGESQAHQAVTANAADLRGNPGVGGVNLARRGGPARRWARAQKTGTGVMGAIRKWPGIRLSDVRIERRGRGDRPAGRTLRLWPDRDDPPA